MEFPDQIGIGVVTKKCQTQLKYVVLATLTLLGAGCVVMKTWKEDFAGPGIPPAVAAGGYASRLAPHGVDQYVSLSIELQRAPLFVFVFPEGDKADSRSITATMLSEHGFAKESYRGNEWSWSRNPPGSIAWLANRRLIYSFGFRGASFAQELHIESCGETFKGALGTSDGVRFFDFPLAKVDLEQLFGTTSGKSELEVVLDPDCL